MRRNPNIKRVNPLFPIILFSILMLYYNISLSSSNFNEWGISKGDVIKKYLSMDKSFSEFNAHKQKYKNKIMNYIIAIDNDLRSEITILRSREKPVRDFLLVKNRLYSVLENHGAISRSEQNRIIKKLTSEYGNPTIQSDKGMTIYSFKGKNTKVLLLLNTRSNNIRCKVYFYASKLFKMLISE